MNLKLQVYCRGTSYFLCQIIPRIKRRKYEFRCTCDKGNGYYILFDYMN